MSADSGPTLPLEGTFLLPPGTYLDGNSLGPLSYPAQHAIERRLRQWQAKGVTAWDEWFGLAERLSPALGRLVGAQPDEVIATGSITANLHALLATFYRPEGERRRIVATELDFPSDLYALRAWAEREGGELHLVPSRDGHTLELEDLLDALDERVALAWLPTVLYRSGQRLPVRTLTAKAHEVGALAGWDAAHSVGAIPHTLHDDGVDIAVWCHYKYVGAGPGAPGGLFVHGRHADRRPALPGWWGNDKAGQFAMDPTFEPAAGAGRFQISTPPILALAGLEGALAIFEQVGVEAIRRRSLVLTDHLFARLDADLPEVRSPTPRAPDERGGHVALAHPSARALSEGLRARGVVPDFRPPDLVRLAPVALYNDEADVDRAIDVLRDLLNADPDDDPAPAAAAPGRVP